MKFGDFEIRTFVEHKIRLDGGSMFGVVPKSLWEKSIPADDDNLIPMHTNIYVLTAHGKNFIFDLGLGDTLSDKEKKIYGIGEGQSNLESGLRGLGLSTDDIDYVILSHLHTDHAAGSVRIEDGEYVPRFEKARYIASKIEWKPATEPNERTAAAYVPARYHALKDSGRLDLIDGNTELFPGIRAVHTGGHTEGHFALEMESEGIKVFYYGDIFPTTAHMPVAFVPGVDLFPLQSMDMKRKKLPEIVTDGVILAFDHDAFTQFGRVRQHGRRFVVERVEEEVTAKTS